MMQMASRLLQSLLRPNWHNTDKRRTPEIFRGFLLKYKGGNDISRKILGSIFLAIAVLTAGCGSQNGKKVNDAVLDPDNPVSLTIWHYYNGAQQATFDALVEEFNSSVGKEKGIYVEAYSQGSVSDLEQAVSDAMEGKVGAEQLPDIFSSYADTAYSAQKQDILTDLTAYFSKEELDAYVEPYIGEGYLNQDGALYLFPVAKSTEIMMLNQTDWVPFAEETGTSLEELATTEGIVKVAEKYYQ